MNIRRLPRFYKLLNFYPPFLGAGIRVKEVSKDKTRFVAEMKLRWYNKNAAGTHFGGSLYSMCDPFYIMIIHAYFGDEYIFWDKSASIAYKHPAKGTVQAIFEIPPATLAEMKKQVDEKGKMSFSFSTRITDAKGKIVAEVEKEIYVRRKA
ncbi:MAG: YiiD C-terminal domain-containing protein [Bacteroidia bacterium]